MFWKRDTIDEMDRTTVDEMDRTVVDDMSQTDSSDYYDSTRYYDPSRYGTANDASHDSHLCEEGHDHDSNDRRRSVSYSQPKEKTPYGGHLCEDGERHERTSDARQRLENKHNTVSYREGKEHPTTSGIPFTSVTDYSPKPPGKIFTDTGAGGDAQKNPASLRMIGIILLVVGFITIESIGFVFIIAGSIIMKMASAVKEEGKQSSVSPRNHIERNHTEQPSNEFNTAKAVIIIVMLGIIAIAALIVITNMREVFSEFE